MENRDEWKFKIGERAARGGQKGWNYSRNYSSWKIQAWRIALTMRDRCLSAKNEVIGKKREKKKRKNKKEWMERGGYCRYKRLSERYFRRPYFGLPQINRTRGVEKCMGNEGRNKREEDIYLFFFVFFFSPRKEEKDEARRARFAFGRCWEIERGGKG